MTLSKSLITGHLNDATQIRFTLSAWDSELAEIVLSQSQTFDLVDGDIPDTCLIWQNQAGLRGTSYTVTAINRGGDGFPAREELGIIQVGTASSYVLADLLEASSVITPGNTYTVLTEAERAQLVTLTGSQTLTNKTLTLATFQGTLAQFFAANAELASLPNGTVLFIGPLGFIKNSASSKVAGAPGWDAMSPVRPEHFADNTTPGTTDISAAAIAALTGYNECRFGFDGLQSNYFCASALGAYTQAVVTGANREKTIITFGAGIDPATPGLSLGQRSKISGLTLEYEDTAITETEVQGERVLLDLGTSANVMTKAAYGADDVRFGRCGTAIASSDAAAFNYSITNCFFRRWSYKPYVLPIGTGLTMDNIYLEGGFDYPSKGGPEFERRATKYSSGSVSSLGQLNIHQVVTDGPLIHIDGCDGVEFRAIHAEDNIFTANDQAAFYFASANVHLGQFEFIHSTHLGSDQSIFLLGRGGQETSATGYTTKESQITFDTFFLQGINQPNVPARASTILTGFANPSSITDPAAEAPTGFKMFRREVGEPGIYTVDLGFCGIHQYAATTFPDDVTFLQAPRVHSDEDVIFTSSRVRENFCPNGKLYGWLKTPNTVTNDEMATNWFVKYSSGTLRAERIIEQWQGKSIALLRTYNTATTGNYHYVEYKIKDPHRFIGAAEMTLSFLAKVGVAAQTINRIYLVRDDGAGGTVTETMILGTKPELAFETTLRRHQVNFVNHLTAFTPAGLTPTVTIRFVINTTTPVTCDLYLGDLALEIGEQQTQSEV